MPRNYSLITIKTLFGRAQRCAYPGCKEPLIFEDRGASTVVAQIAHIRSEKINGPRHDPAYTGDVNGEPNLLLLCGKHHPPVDHHESIYPIEELLVWKTRQVSTAGTGTPISSDDAKRFVGMTQEERQAMAEVARLTTRVQRACETAHTHLLQIEVERLQALRALRNQFGPAYAIDEHGNSVLNEDGTKVNVNDTLQMPPLEAEKWDHRANESLRADWPAIHAALGQLDEEVNVLRMMNPPLGAGANKVLLMAEEVAQAIRSQDTMDRSIVDMRAALHDMWLLANPE